MNVLHFPSSMAITLFLQHHEKIMATLFSGLMSLLLGLYNREFMIIKNMTASVMCALISWYVYDVLLITLALPLEWVNLISVLIGLLGFDYTRVLLIKLVGDKLDKIFEPRKLR